MKIVLTDAQTVLDDIVNADVLNRSDNGAVKTGQATAIALLAVLACAGGLSMYALKKKKEL